MNANEAVLQTEFVYRVQPSRIEMLTEGPTEVEAATVGRHFAYLQDLTEQGIVVLAGRTLNDDPSTFGIIVFRAPTIEDARMIVENDPAVKGGVMRAELFPFRIALQARI